MRSCHNSLFLMVTGEDQKFFFETALRAHEKGESMKETGLCFEPHNTVASRPGHIELSPECAPAKRSGFKPN